MNNYLPENETVEVENRLYLNPNLPVEETNRFVDNLRQTQAAQNAQIAEQTRMLGTDVPTSLGGLAGGNASSYWTSRYQTPTTNALVQDLRTAAQASALNQALQNEQEMWKKRYQDAYRRYQKSAYDKANQPSTNGGNTLDIDTNANTNEKTELDFYEPQAGQIIPNTDYISDYQDASTKQWYQLTSPREIDVIAARSSLVGQNPSDGTTVTVPSGKTLRYVAATDSWYEQTNSAGPNTYSPRAR